MNSRIRFALANRDLTHLDDDTLVCGLVYLAFFK